MSILLKIHHMQCHTDACMQEVRWQTGIAGAIVVVYLWLEEKLSQFLQCGCLTMMLCGWLVQNSTHTNRLLYAHVECTPYMQRLYRPCKWHLVLYSLKRTDDSYLISVVYTMLVYEDTVHVICLNHDWKRTMGAKLINNSKILNIKIFFYCKQHFLTNIKKTALNSVHAYHYSIIAKFILFRLVYSTL